MLIATDFRKARFTPRDENPFRLTPPRRQAIFVHEENAPQQPEQNSSENESENSPYEKVSFSDFTDALKNYAKQKQHQGFALLDLLNSELMLIKKSIFVTVFAGMTAFAIGGFCWTLLNIALGYFAHLAGAPVSIILVVMLVINAIIGVVIFKQAQSAFKYISASRIIQLMKRLND